MPPMHRASAVLHEFLSTVHGWFVRVVSWIGG